MPPRATLQSLITDAIDNGYDVTVRLRQRDDGQSGSLSIPNNWARALGLTEAEMDRLRAQAAQDQQVN